MWCSVESMRPNYPHCSRSAQQNGFCSSRTSHSEADLGPEERHDDSQAKWLRPGLRRALSRKRRRADSGIQSWNTPVHFNQSQEGPAPDTHAASSVVLRAAVCVDAAHGKCEVNTCDTMSQHYKEYDTFKYFAFVIQQPRCSPLLWRALYMNYPFR